MENPNKKDKPRKKIKRDPNFLTFFTFRQLRRTFTKRVFEKLKQAKFNNKYLSKKLSQGMFSSLREIKIGKQSNPLIYKYPDGSIDRRTNYERHSKRLA